MLEYAKSFFASSAERHLGMNGSAAIDRRDARRETRSAATLSQDGAAHHAATPTPMTTTLQTMCLDSHAPSSEAEEKPRPLRRQTTCMGSQDLAEKLGWSAGSESCMSSESDHIPARPSQLLRRTTTCLGSQDLAGQIERSDESHETLPSQATEQTVETSKRMLRRQTTCLSSKDLLSQVSQATLVEERQASASSFNLDFGFARSLSLLTARASCNRRRRCVCARRSGAAEAVVRDSHEGAERPLLCRVTDVDAQELNFEDA